MNDYAPFRTVHHLRLCHLVRVLTTPLPTQSFHMDMWYNQLDEDEKEVYDLNVCGFTACAAGHAGLDPWFRANGLIYDKDRRSDTGCISGTSSSGSADLQPLK